MFELDFLRQIAAEFKELGDRTTEPFRERYLRIIDDFSRHSAVAAMIFRTRRARCFRASRELRSMRRSTVEPALHGRLFCGTVRLASGLSR